MQHKAIVVPGGQRLDSVAQRTPDGERVRIRKSETFGLLERICQEFELTPTQFERAERAYQAVGEWLAADPRLASAEVYVQGSVAHGTTTKPIAGNEHDVDAVCFIASAAPSIPPAVIKTLIGERLRAHGTYRQMVEEKPRCWRLNYAGDFHLDLTPSIKNPACPNDGELVPDKSLGNWKASNPRGFRNLFDRRASLTPSAPVRDQRARVSKADVEPFPELKSVKGILRRAVQLSKRHRDIVFLDDEDGLAPLSIIITTLGSRAYEYCVTHHAYDNELDLLCDTIRVMPRFIETGVAHGRETWLVPNETTRGENFAEKWSDNPAKAAAFLSWQERALADFEASKNLLGTDALVGFWSERLGGEPVAKAMASVTCERTIARSAGRLTVASGVGLTAAGGGTAVRANTFFGR